MSGEYSKECKREAMAVLAKIDDRVVRKPKSFNPCIALQRIGPILNKPIPEGEWRIISDTSDMSGYYATPEESAHFMSKNQVDLFMSQFKDHSTNRIAAANKKFHLRKYPLTAEVINYANKDVPEYLIEIGALELFPLLNAQPHESSQLPIYFYPWNMISLDDECPHPQTHRYHKGYKLPPIYIVSPKWDVVDRYIGSPVQTIPMLNNGKARVIINTTEQTIKLVNADGVDLTRKTTFQCYKGNNRTQQFVFITHVKANMQNDRNLIAKRISDALGHNKTATDDPTQIKIVNQQILDLYSRMEVDTMSIKGFHSQFMEYKGKLLIHCDIEIQ